jgi:signal transduction histidine kinase
VRFKRDGAGVGLRTQILLILFGGAILPLALVGLWLSTSAYRSGAALLRNHLDASADAFASAIAARWNYRVADLELIATNEASVHAALGQSLTTVDSTYLSDLGAAVARSVRSIELRDRAKHVVWQATISAPGEGPRANTPNAAALPAPAGTVPLEATIRDSENATLGTAIIRVTAASLVPPDSARPLIPGSQVVIRDMRSDVVLAGRDVFNESGLSGRRVRIAEADWLVVHRHIAPSPLRLTVAAPLAPYVTPLESASRFGFMALAGVAALAFLLTGFLALRATGPLQDLVAASESVAQGELDHQLVEAGPAEIRRVGTAFNIMLRNLRCTLDDLSKQNALAAVGEFATSLSHDVRNSLTAIKVDLERVARRPAELIPAGVLVQRALNNVVRLESSVSGALRAARHATHPVETTDLRAAIQSAADTVSGTFASLPAMLVVDLPDDPVLVHADGPAVEQVIANLLFNAAQALKADGLCRVSVSVSNGTVDVLVSDNGCGMTEDEVGRLGSPFYSTKPGGTGFGMSFAKRIIAANNGELTIQSRHGIGTSIRVRLPRLHESSN